MPRSPTDSSEELGNQPTAVADDALGATATGDGEHKDHDPAAELDRGSALGRYTILAKLGAGGMGVVYAAYDPDLDRKVALKLLRGARGKASQSARTRLLREARAMAKLAHPNVITVFEVGSVSDVDFVAMEFVDGPDLEGWCAEEERDWQEILRVFLQAGRGLAAAHRAGLVHRDFKPGNVLLRDGEVALVTDFGLARTKEDAIVTRSIDALRDVDDSNLTQTGAILGTPAYMSPEQHAGSPATELSDQFGFCAALYEALYGIRPFPGRTVEDIRKSIEKGVPAEPKGKSPDVPARLRRVVLRGLQARPNDRYPSMDALLAELSKSTAGRRRYLAAVALAAVGIGAGVLAVKATSSKPAAAAACSDASDRLRGVWSDQRRTELARAFEGTQGFQGFAAEVDDYVKSWRETYRQSCLAASQDSAREADHLLTLDCLLRRRDSLDSMLEVFAGSDDAALDNAVMAAASLPAIGTCADAAALRSGVQPPAGKAQSREVARIRGVLDEVEALHNALRLKEARAKSKQAVSDAREVDYPPVLAQALVAHAEQIRGQEPKQATEEIEEAVLLAEEAGDDHMRATALVQLFAVQSRVSTDHSMLDQLARRAESAVQRFGRDDKLLGELRLLRAREDLARGKLESAQELFEEALAIYQRVYGPEDLKLVDVYIGLAGVAGRRGKWESAVAHQQSALAIEKRHHPDSHARVVMKVEGLAQIYSALGRDEESRKLMEETAGFWSTRRGKELLRASLAEGSGLDAPTKTIRGVVVDSTGEPVAGAEVVAGKVLASDGTYLASRKGGMLAARWRIARTTSDTDGRFELEVADDADLFVAAEHADRGRSILPIEPPIEEGKEHSRPFRLELSPYGRLEGRAIGAENLPEGTMLAAGLVKSKGSSVALAQVVARGGRFKFPRVPAGRYVLRLVRSNQEASNVESTAVEIRPGETTRAELDLAARGQRLEVIVKLKGGGEVTAAQVLLLEGKFDIEHGGDEANAKLLSQPRLRSAFTNRSEPAVFSGVAPGEYSVCVVPLAGDVADPDFMEAVMDNIEKVEIHCHPAVISASDPSAVVVEVEEAYSAPDR